MKLFKKLILMLFITVGVASITNAGDTYIDLVNEEIWVVSTYVDDYACAGNAGNCTRRVSYLY